MSTLKLNLDLNNPLQMRAAADFFTALSSDGSKVIQQPFSRDAIKKVEEENRKESISDLPVNSPEEVKPETDVIDHPAKDWTEDSMRDMKAKDLKATCDELAIDYNASSGMNTNAKLRKLILGKFSGANASAEPAKTEPAKTEPAKTEPAKTESTGVTRDDVRKLVPVKAKAGHIDAMKAKLKELGAPNITTLKDEHLEDFYNLLNEL